MFLCILKYVVYSLNSPYNSFKEIYLYTYYRDRLCLMKIVQQLTITDN